MSRWQALTFLAVPLLSGVLSAQADDPAQALDFDPTELSLEELMSIDIEVTSVSKKPQSLKDIPAAVFVISQEDIRRSTATSIPELLRMVPGLHVARINGSVYAVTARGFNGQFANKLLVLVDGRSVYTPLFSGVYWDTQDTALEDIERIEVIRGPGAAVWGANAVNGVINIITKRAEDTQGGLVSAIVGTEERHNLTVRQGGALESGFWRAWFKTYERDSLVRPSGGDARDGVRTDRAGFRIDLAPREGDELTLTGDAYTFRSDYSVDVPDLASPPTTRVGLDADSGGGHVMATWRRLLEDGSDVSLQTFYSRDEGKSTMYVEKRDMFDVEVRHHTEPVEDHDVVWGVSFRATKTRVDPTPFVAMRDRSNTEDLFSVFAQDEIALGEAVSLTVGSKFERNSYTGWEVQPDLRLAYRPNEEETWWASLSRAVRTPSMVEWESIADLAVLGNTPFPGFTTLLQVQGGEDVEAEKLTAAQFGYRVDVNDELSLDATTYYHHYDDLITFELGQGVPSGPTTIIVPLVTDNRREGRVIGFEFVADWQPSDDWEVLASYAYADMELDVSKSSTADVADERTVPQDMLNLNVHHDLDERWSMDLGAHFVDNVPGLGIEHYVSGNLRVAWRDDTSEWSLGLVNVFHDEEAEWVGGFNTPTHVEAGAYLQYTRQF